MLQIIQDLKRGDTLLEEIPAPLVRRGHVLIKTHRTLVSLGTEKMLVEFGKSSLIAKARQQPEKVKQVLDKIRTEGLLPTLEAVFNKLDEPLPLGYCNAGEVIAVGEDVTEFSIGDRVASNGNHAEIVCIPKNLVAKIPDGVSYDHACFAVIGSIGLQGIRLINPTLGETVVVIGLGLIGLITVKLLLANGCNVIGFDFDEAKVNLANQMGAKAFSVAKNDPVRIIETETNGTGADAILITASTKSNDVISQAAKMSRKKGRIVLVGVIGLDIKRDDFFKKELSFQVSCSYGPGRYDEDYEQKGNDYPIGYVRWTEKRNFETILLAIAKGKLNVEGLITERVPLKDYLNIYNNMGGGSIASVLEFDTDKQAETATSCLVTKRSAEPAKGVIGIVGAGNFTKMTVMPSLKNSGAYYKWISSAAGLTATSLAKKYGFEYATSSYHEILEDKEVDLVLITTRHNMHAKMVVEGLQAGKHVFVEKPLAINEAGLTDIISAYQSADSSVSLSVGYNRRFSPFMQKAKKILDGGMPISIIATMNAGFIPLDSWVQDMKVGGGRIIGEACHFIDLMIYLTGSLVTEVTMTAMGTNPDPSTDNAMILLKFSNGSQGVINYLANGSKSYPKERIEIFSQGRTLIVDNFRTMKGFGFKNFSSFKTSIDKGHKTQFSRLVAGIKNGSDPLIAFEELVNSARASFAAIKSLQEKKWISIQQEI